MLCFIFVLSPILHTFWPGDTMWIWVNISSGNFPRSVHESIKYVLRHLQHYYPISQGSMSYWYHLAKLSIFFWVVSPALRQSYILLSQCQWRDHEGHVDGLVEDCSNSIANTHELLQSKLSHQCIKLLSSRPQQKTTMFKPTELLLCTVCTYFCIFYF